MDFSGIYPPVVTPFDERGEVSYDRFEENLEKWSSTGLAGFVIFGSNGEYVFLTAEEKLKLIERAAKTVPGGKKIIAGTGCESTRDTISLTNAAADAGAAAALIVTPCYYSDKMSKKALLNHYITVADNSKIPVLLYNVPKYTGVNMAPDLVAELSKHPNIVGIKDSTGNVAQLGEILNGVEEDFYVLVGTAGALYPALAIGAAGGVLALANIAPAECVDVYNLFKSGRHNEARDIYRRMLPVNTAVTATYGIAGLKAAMDIIGYYGGPPRSPLLPLDDEGKAAVRRILETAGLI
jgi:4-hydroxy-2-oxoglutarate aldolase